MATVCECNLGLSNTGTPDCQNVQNVTAKIILLNTFDSDGNRNFIDTTVTLDQTFVNDRINDDDESKKWRPLSRKKMKNVEDVKGDSVFETFNDTSNVFIREGARTFNALILSQSSTFLGKIKSARCVDISVFLVDIEGNLIGATQESGKLFPIRVDKETWNPIDVRKTDSTSQRISLSFEFSDIESDEDIKMIKASEFEAGVSLLTERGLIDVNGVVSDITLTTFTLTTTFDYGTAVTAAPFEGKDDPSDWALAEVTPTPGSIVITSVTEVLAGVYDFVMPAASSADVLSLDLDPTVLGFDMDQISITIP